jgi:hypothetical protein
LARWNPLYLYVEHTTLAPNTQVRNGRLLRNQKLHGLCQRKCTYLLAVDRNQFVTLLQSCFCGGSAWKYLVDERPRRILAGHYLSADAIPLQKLGQGWATVSRSRAG